MRTIEGRTPCLVWMLRRSAWSTSFTRGSGIAATLLLRPQPLSANGYVDWVLVTWSKRIAGKTDFCRVGQAIRPE